MTTRPASLAAVPAEHRAGVPALQVAGADGATPGPVKGSGLSLPKDLLCEESHIKIDVSLLRVSSWCASGVL